MSIEKLFIATIRERSPAGGDSYPPGSQPKYSKRESDRLWVPKGQTVTVSKLKISKGMIYVGEHLAPQYAYTRGESDNCLINPKLRVARNSHGRSQEDMPYWPSYSYISPENRRAYLEWLADGAKDPEVCIGYVFLYFYGLERRLFLDQSPAESADIIKEIERLLSLYGHNRSVRRYLNEALALSKIIFQKKTSAIPELKPRRTYFWELPLSVKLYIGKKIKNKKPISGDDLLMWFFHHPDTRLRTPARRLEEEFIALMRHKLNEKYPFGLKIKPPGGKISAVYQASSRTFEVDLSNYIGRVPDISGLTSPIGNVRQMADQSMESLDRLSRFIGKNPEKRETLRAATLLPGEIIMEFGGAPVEQLNEWLREMHQSENGVVSVADLSERATASSSKIITAVHRDIYSLLEALGWSMFPAPQEVVGAIRNDYKVMFVPADQGGRVAETPGANYLLSILKLTLGAYIAHADDAFIAGEKRYLDRLVSDSEGITGREKQRLRQFINWLAVQKIDFSSIKRGIKAADEGDRQVLADMAISVAAADGRIAPQEVRALEDLYSAMGLDRQDLISRLHDLSTRPAKTPEEKTSSGTDAPLDPEKISAILRDTDRASALLENIFQAEEQDVRHESPDDAEESDDAESVLDGLERLHARLLSELMEKDEWTRGEYERLASGLNLMPDGALEVINEWSFGKFDDIMIDDGDLISVNRELVERRRTK